MDQVATSYLLDEGCARAHSFVLTPLRGESTIDEIDCRYAMRRPFHNYLRKKISQSRIIRVRQEFAFQTIYNNNL